MSEWNGDIKAWEAELERREREHQELWKQDPPADPAPDTQRLDFIEKMLMQDETSMLNDMIYACVKSYEAFGRGPALRTIIDGLMAQVKGEV